MQKSSPSRRGLLKAAGVGAALASLPKWFVEETLDAAEPDAPPRPMTSPALP